MSYCNNQVYVAWAGADDYIRVGWGSTGGGFSNVVTYTDTALYNQTDQLYTSPALACWRPASGTWSDRTRLWIAFTGTNNVLYVGYFNGTTDNGKRINGHWTVSNQTGGNQSAERSPALAVQGGTMRIGWVGVNNEHVNIELSTTGNSWNSPNTWSAQTASGGLGLAIFCPSGVCNLWIAWPGTDSGHHINIGRWNLSGGGFTQVSPNGGLADFTCFICDLTLAPQGSTLRLPYSGGNHNMNVDNSTDGKGWSNDQGTWNSIWGIGGAVDGAGHMWLTWVDYADTQIRIGTYN